MRKQVQYIPQKGMNKDLSISKFSPEFTYDNYNMRLNANEENTLFTITNAKGNVKAVILDEDTDEEVVIKGNTIGYCILNEFLVLFTTTRDTTTELVGNQKAPEGIDRIYRLHRDALYNSRTIFNVDAKLLFEGEGANSLNFCKESLIETLPIFESDNIQKIYWVDKYNQPRFINIKSDKIGSFTNNSFEFCPELKLQENYEIKKSFSGGSFHSGVVQYAFSYWNRNGVESNIFLTTDVYSLSEKNKAGSAEEIVNCSYKVTVSNLDTSFDYVRMYAIQRTSFDGTSVARIVKDVELSKIEYNQYAFTDDGVIGSSFPAESLFFIGGEELIIGSITTKDNTLFGSNLKLKRPYIGNIEIKDKSKYPEDYNIEFSWKYNYTDIQPFYPMSSWSGNYANSIYTYKPYTLYENHLGQYGNGSSNTNVRHWKKGETYRLGIQAQYKTGIWSEVIYLGDYKVDRGFSNEILGYWGSIETAYFLDYTLLRYVSGELRISTELSNELISKGFKRVRPVYVPLTYKDRHIIGQGILTNTIGNVVNRGNNTPFAYTDYYTRGQHELVPVTNKNTVGNRYTNTDHDGHLVYPSWQHFSMLRKSKNYITNNRNNFEYIEIKGSQRLNDSDADVDSITNGAVSDGLYWEKFNGGWFIDSNLVNLWSPDVEYGDVRHHLDNISHVVFRGSANISSSNVYYNTISSLGTNDGQNLAIPNFNYGASRVLARFGVNSNMRGDWNDTDNNLEVGYIWDSKKVEEGGDIEYKKKTISRFVYCGFNDMFLDYNSSNVAINEYRLSIYTPKFVDKTDVAVSYNTDSADGASGNISYLSSLDEVIGNYNNDKSKLSATSVNYKTNTHLLFSFQYSNTLPIYSAYTSGGNNKVRTSYNKPYYRKGQYSGSFSTPIIDSLKYLNIENSRMVNRLSSGNWYVSGPFNSGWPYLWIVDLYRDISSEVQYGGNDVNAINQNTWIACGNSVELSSYYSNILFSRGDTFIQRYDCLRTNKGTSDFQDYTEVVSVLLESFVNIDGRWDSKRGNLVIKNYTTDNYTLINPVYSQKNNFFTGTTLDSNLLAADSLPTSFLWSEAKVYNESIDKWTGLWLNNSYTVDGSLGTVNYLDTFNNELYGFQDKGIFQILFNSRVQVPTSDNTPIELVQSWKTQGVRYITNNMGVTNKWTVKQSSRALYFIDSLNRDICLLNTPPSILSDSLGFKTWSQSTITKIQEYNIYNNKESFITNIDEISDNVYFNNTYNSLMFSETLNQFESFFSHEDIPFMFNIWGDFLSIKNVEDNTSLWINNIGDYNSFYGELKKSHIEFYINPEMSFDKVFDNFQYRADMFDDSTYIPRETFNKVYVSNEYQQGERDIMNTMPTYNSKKFRIWNFPFPRQNNSLNRIRNPWVKLKLELTNNNYRKLLFHDLIITYTV